MYEKSRGDIFISVRSRDLINMSKETDFNNYGRFDLFQEILAQENEILAVQLVSATIPNSFYNLSNNNNNNTITFNENAGAYTTLTISSGSYNILELSAEIKSLLEAQSIINGNSLTYTFSYDEITNTLNIKSSNSLLPTIFDFTTITSCRRFLGFTSKFATINTVAGITSDRSVDITDTKNSIYVRLPNLSNSKVIESSTGKFSNVVAVLPVELSRNNFFFYEPPVPFIVELSQKQINSIDFLITYQNELENVNFERADWELNLMISFFHTNQRNAQIDNHLHNLPAELDNQINKFYINQMEQQNKEKMLNDFVKNNELKIN